MRPTLALAALIAFIAFPVGVRADRPAEAEAELIEPFADDSPGTGARSSRAAGGRVAGGYAGVRARRVPDPIPGLTRDELRLALERARLEMQACADGAGLRGANITARISRDAALRLTVRGRPRDTGAEMCIDTAARRHVTPLLSRPITRALSATVRLGASGPRPPSPPPPRPPVGVDEREIHDRIDASSGSLRRCLDEAYPGLTGTVTLRVAAHRDGTMTLESASLPPGVAAGPMLVCLQSEVSRLHVTAGAERRATHDLHLGR